MKASLYISIALVLTICALTLAQGGFYFAPVTIAGAFCLVLGIVCLIIYRKKLATIFSSWRKWILPASFLLITVLNAASAFVNGFTYESAEVILCWISVTLFSFTCCFSESAEKDYVLNGFCWFLFAISFVACLSFIGIIPESGDIVANGRLCMLFEYSNATGIWLGMGALIASASYNARIRALISLPLFAMLLTKSVGAISVLTFAVIVAIIIYVKTDARKATTLALSWAIALLAFALGLISPVIGVVGLFVLDAAMLVFTEFVKKSEDGFDQHGQKNSKLSKQKKSKAQLESARKKVSPAEPSCIIANKRICIISITGAAVITCCAVAAAILLEPARLIEAQGTFTERLIQIQDGLKLLSTNVLLGIGPEQWGNAYQAIQTVDYTAEVNHCSYLQMALDGGVIVPLVYLATMIFATIKNWKSGRRIWSLAAIALLLHSVFDFDLHFYALQFLAIFLISPDYSAGEKSEI